MPRVQLREKRVLITGASSGIGWALAEAMAARGARLAVVARREERLRALAARIEAAGHVAPAIVVADLAQRGSAADVARQVTRALGDVDVLVNNAGGAVGGTQWRVGDGDEARDAFELNLWSPLALVAALVPRLRERGDGAVVNVTSLSQ